MGVQANDKKALAKAWKEADASASAVPAGKYQFEIKTAVFKDGDKGPKIKQTLEVVGGNEEYVGETLSIIDNIATTQNMGFFKQKLTRLGIEIPTDFEDIENGTICEEMVGKVFDGELKLSGGFVNVYVTKLASGPETAEDDEEEEEDEEDEKPAKKGKKPVADEDDESDEEDAEETDSDEDESSEDDEEDEKPAKKKAKKVEEDDEASDAEEGDDDSEEEEDGDEFPTPDEVKAMKIKEVSGILSQLGIDAKEVEAPKIVLTTISNYLYTKGFKPEIDAFKAVVHALKIKGLKDLEPKQKNEKVLKTIKSLFA